MANELSRVPTSNGLEGRTGSDIANAVLAGSSALRNAVGKDSLGNPVKFNSENFSQIGQLVISTDSWRNEFIHTLHDKIGLYVYGYNIFKGDLNGLKKDMLKTGAVVDEMQMDLIEPIPYNPEVDWKKALANFVPTYLELFHKINRADVYPLTVSRQQLQRAFTSEQSFMEFITAQFALPVESNNADEYEWFLKLINYVSTNVAYHIKVNGFDTKDNVLKSTETIRQWALDLQKPSRKFNVAGFKRSVPYDRLIMITTSKVLAAMDVQSLAVAFNMSKADFIANKVYVVPSWVDLGNNIDFLLGDERAFQIYDVVYATDENHNGLTRSQNYFLHVQQIFSSSITYPVIAGKHTEVTSTVLGDFTPATGTSMSQAQTSMIKCAITSGDNKQIIYSLSGNYDPNTYITPYGLLYIGQRERASELKITATAGTVVKQAVYNITQNAPVFGAVSPQDGTTLAKNSTTQIYVDLLTGEGTPVFSLKEGQTVVEGTGITPTGSLKIASGETLTSITVVATLAGVTKEVTYKIATS